MKKFIRIDSNGLAGPITLLNLAWVAKVELLYNHPPRGKQGVQLKCIADDGFTLATLYFDSVEAGNRWVADYLDVAL